MARQRRRNVMNYLFSMVPKANIPRSTFDRSHNLKTTLDAGYLVPIFCDDVLPADTFKLRCSFMVRLQPLVRPIMDDIYLDSFFFFVPYRLIWEHWINMQGERRNPDDSIDFMTPTVSGTHVQTQTLWDYLGMPTYVNNALTVNSLSFRAYNKIYNDWFRDENLQDSVPENYDDGPDDLSDYVLLRRGKRHDYFTSCLPWAQKGDPVSLPLGNDAPVSGTATFTNFPSGVLKNTGADPAVSGQVSGILGNLSGSVPVWESNSNVAAAAGSPATVNGVGVSGLTADLTSATAVLVNQLRFSFQLQKLFERDARGGTRYIEQILSHFGVVSPDARLQRPEYLGGTSTRVNINPVTQTGSTDSTSPQGNLAAYGVADTRIHGFNKSFTEHGVILGMVSVRANLTYQQGIPKMFLRRTRTDYYLPVFSHIGEQPVTNVEIYAQGTAADDEVFGYQEAWADYRYKPSVITGKFRSTDPATLDVWHLAQKFDNLPVLNEEFIIENPPIDRAVAVTDEPQFFLDAHFDLKCTRPMPVYSVPGLIDHF